MGGKKINWKRWSVFYGFLLLVFLHDYISLAQNRMRKVKYGTAVRLNNHASMVFEDDMCIELIRFSHKHALVGNSTKATAYIRISNGTVVEEEFLSVYEGDSSIRYDSLVWNEYTFHLKEFYYDEAVVIVVEKKE